MIYNIQKHIELYPQILADISSENYGTYFKKNPSSLRKGSSIFENAFGLGNEI
jgi:hypothetical protein